MFFTSSIVKLEQNQSCDLAFRLGNSKTKNAQVSYAVTLSVLFHISQLTIATAVHCKVILKNLQNFNELHGCGMSLHWCGVRKVDLIPCCLVEPVHIMEIGIVE